MKVWNVKVVDFTFLVTVLATLLVPKHINILH